MRRQWFIGWVGILFIWGAAAAQSALDVPILVDEPAGVERTNAPVTGGVPLPPGTVRSVDDLALLGPDGKPVPVQLAPLVRLEDGSLHWVLLDFQATLPAKGQATFRLVRSAGKPGDSTGVSRPVRSVKTSSGRAVRDSRENPAGEDRPGHTIDRNSGMPSPDFPRAGVTGRDGEFDILTGVLRATINVNRFDLFDRVSVDLNGDGAFDASERVAHADEGVPSISLVDGETGALCAARWGGPAKVDIEEPGPLRVCVKVTGRYATEKGEPCGLEYTTRLTGFAGQAYLIVEHRLRNSDPAAARDVRIDRATLSTVFDARDPMVYHVGAQEVLTGRFAERELDESRVKSLYLHQSGPPRPILDKGDWRDHARYSGTEAGYKLYTTRSKGRRPIIDLGWWAKGWLDITDTRAGLLVGVQDFANDWPLAVGAEVIELAPPALVRMSVDLIPPAQGSGVPRYADAHFLLNDLMHKSARILFDFHGPKVEAADLEARVARFRGPLVPRAPADWYNTCDALAGEFATLEDELAAYKAWRWSFEEHQPPSDPHSPERFVMYTDVHWVSEADDAADNLLQFIRTGQRGFFDRGAAWARYYRDTYAPRSDGFVYSDQRPTAAREKPLSPAERQTLYSWHAGSLRGDLTGLCHAYGAGLVDHYLMTGERESLAAAEDLAELIAARTARAEPGKSSVGGRGWGRMLLIACRVYEGTRAPGWLDLVKRLGRTCAVAPNRDERGMTPTGGYGWNGPARTPRGQQLIQQLDLKPHTVVTSGTWGDALFAAGLDRYYALTGDEDARDLVIGYGELMNRYGIHKTLHCASYYYEWDFPRKGDVWFSNLDGQLNPQPGNDWYSTSVTDMPVRAWRHTGRRALLEQGRRFWTIGRQHLHDPARWFQPQAAEGLMGAGHTRYAKLLFRAYGRPRPDTEPPPAVADLAATVSGTEVALTWTAPADAAVYQVKVAGLPIVAYEDYDYARDDGVRRNWWYAANVAGEPMPGKAGAAERFVLKGLAAGTHYIALRSRDAASNESALSNVVRVVIE